MNDDHRLAHYGARSVDRLAIAVTPKRFTRVERLRHLTGEVAATPTADWAQLAFEPGHADQAHLIDDFRDVVGVTDVLRGQPH